MRLHRDLTKAFISNLNRLCEDKGVSVTTLASMIGASRQYIYNLKDGTNSPTLPMVGKIAEALGVRPEELIK